MASGERTYEWRWHLRSSPDALWPLVADTDRFDRDVGVPPIDRSDDDGLGNGRVRVRLHQFGVPLEYVQEPFEWDEPTGFSVVRRFTRGPLAELRITLSLSPADDGGSELDYRVTAVPTSALTAPAIPVQVGRILARRFDRTFRRYDELAVATGDTTGDTTGERPGVRPRPPSPPVGATSGSVALAPGGAQRLASQRDELTAAGVDAALADRLLETVRTSDDVVASHLRAYALADAWGLERRAVLEACLIATRTGLLELRWDVLCPQCRLPKASVGHLRELPRDVHCDTCNVEYGPDFARSVEVCFAPTAAVRTTSSSAFCVGNPMATPHIAHQRLLAPGASATIGPLPHVDRLRVRRFRRPGATHLLIGAGDDATAELHLDDRAWPGEDRPLALGATLTLRNDSDVEQLVIVERTELGDQVVTAADVTTLQRFRDLFSSEALRPDERVAVGTLAIAFTDLARSTELYRRLGDADAFGRVLDHFEVLTACTAAEGGAVVKTIGDAVMAVFPRPAPALRAMLAAQQAMTAGAAGDDLVLKAGIHTGPCIAVTLNGRLDYFGTTVNLAARLEGQARGDDVVLSGAAADDPEVAAMVAAGEVTAEEATAPLKGFEGDHRLVRVRGTGPAAARAVPDGDQSPPPT